VLEAIANRIRVTRRRYTPAKTDSPSISVMHMLAGWPHFGHAQSSTTVASIFIPHLHGTETTFVRVPKELNNTTDGWLFGYLMTFFQLNRLIRGRMVWWLKWWIRNVMWKEAVMTYFKTLTAAFFRKDWGIPRETVFIIVGMSQIRSRNASYSFATLGPINDLHVSVRPRFSYRCQHFGQ
jgi:hypothetical protein